MTVGHSTTVQFKDVNDLWNFIFKAPGTVENRPKGAKPVGVLVHLKNTSGTFVGTVTHLGSVESLLENITKMVGISTLAGMNMNAITNALVRQYSCHVGVDETVKTHNTVILWPQHTSLQARVNDENGNSVAEGNVHDVLKKIKTASALRSRGISTTLAGWVVEFDYHGGSHDGKRTVYVDEVVTDAATHKTYLKGRDLVELVVNDNESCYRQYLAENIVDKVTPLFKLK